jgi:2-methylaconitate cis-trans-isomerase PrpF
MIGHIAYAEGAPCPTLVLDREKFPDGEDKVRDALVRARRWMAGVGAGSVLKFALIGRSRHPLFDLDYQFVQALPTGLDQFDFRGSCGHSILASVLVASRTGWLSRLSPGSRVRVNVLNNGDNVVAEVDEANRDATSFTVYFLFQPERPLGELLMASAPTTVLDVGGTPLSVSLVSAGNPYVFVRASDLDVHAKESLFAEDPELFSALVRIREAAAESLGWPASGAFPKVAVIGQFEPGRLAVRAVSVPHWHPTVALTGATCLGVSAVIGGTIPAALAEQAGCQFGQIVLDTPGGVSRITVGASGPALSDRVAWASVDRKVVRSVGTLLIQPLESLNAKEMSCLPLPG